MLSLTENTSLYSIAGPGVWGWKRQHFAGDNDNERSFARHLGHKISSWACLAYRKSSDTVNANIESTVQDPFCAIQVQRFEDGERQRYFADDDRKQLGDLVAQQRYEGAADIDANLADNIMRKGKRFRWAYINIPKPDSWSDESSHVLLVAILTGNIVRKLSWAYFQRLKHNSRPDYNNTLLQL